MRNRMTEANQLLKQEKYGAFFNDFVDPFWTARYAAGAGRTVEEFVGQVLKDNAESLQRFAVTITKTLKAEPQWLLNGRAASFMTDHSSHTAEFWIYYDGEVANFTGNLKHSVTTGVAVGTSACRCSVRLHP